MKKKLICTLSVLAAVGVAGVSCTLMSGDKSANNANEGYINTTSISQNADESNKETDISNETVTSSENSETEEVVNTVNNKNQTTDKSDKNNQNSVNQSDNIKDTEVSNNQSNVRSFETNNVRYTIILDEEIGTYTLSINGKVILEDLKHELAETEKYLIYSKLGENNIANSEVGDWDIMFFNKTTGDVTVLEDAQYVEMYVEYSSLYAITDSEFYGVLDDTNTLFKVDLTKDEIVKTPIKDAPKVTNIAGFYEKANLLFLVDESGNIISYNVNTGNLKNHKYYVQTTQESNSFNVIHDSYITLKEFKFIENYTDELYKNKDGIEMYINRHEADEQAIFFAYDSKTNDFYVYQ